MIDMLKAREAVAAFQFLLDRTPPGLAGIRVAPEAWTLAEITGHLIDSASNNHQRFARLRLGELKGFPGYDMEGWVQAQDYAACDFGMLARLWTCYNAFLLHLAGTTPPEALRNAWDGPDGVKTLEFLVNDYFVHLKLHVDHYAGRLGEVEALSARG